METRTETDADMKADMEAEQNSDLEAEIKVGNRKLNNEGWRQRWIWIEA